MTDSTPSSVRGAVHEEIEALMKESGQTVNSFEDSETLMDGLGMDSMQFAVLVVRLEQRLSCDPFNSADLVEYPTTLGEFVRLYEEAAGR